MRYAPREISVLVVLAATVVAGALLAAGVPTVQRLSGWFWPLHDRGLLQLAPLLAVAFAIPLLVGLCMPEDHAASPRRLVGGLVLLVVFGGALQHGLALSEGRGLSGMRDRILWTGHSEFARTASLDLDYWLVLTRYEELVRSPSQAYARSKPPGQLLFYMVLSSVADLVMPDPPPDEPPLEGTINPRHRRLVDFAAVALPFLSYLVLVPLSLLSRRMLPDQVALWPALLFVLAPPTALVTLHLDQALYPLLAATTWLLAAQAGCAGRRSWAWGAAAGAMTWLGVFVSFSLIAAIPLTAVFAWATARQANDRPALRRLLAAGTGFVIAFLLLTSLASHLLNYDLLIRFRAAMLHHREWMISHHPEWSGWPQATGPLLQVGILNLVEFGYWLGIPLLALGIWGLVAGVRAGVHRHCRGNDVVAVALSLVLCLMAVFGGCIGEVARLWIFAIPVVTLIAAERLHNLAGINPRRLLLVLAGMQFAWMFLLKVRQDFW